MPGFDTQLNNLLGESDIASGDPQPGDHLESRMAPSLVFDANGLELAIGSAGATRLRTALATVLAAILDEGLDAETAVGLPRVHPTLDVVDAEPGVDEAALAALEESGRAVRRWDRFHHYFGGVSCVGRAGAAGDPRRSGAATSCEDGRDPPRRRRPPRLVTAPRTRATRRRDRCLGGSVVEALDQPGGFSPGVAARVVLDNGARRFVKIVGDSLNPDAPDLYRREAKVAAALPTNTPAPRLLGSYDDGAWVALVFEDVEGRAPSIPWRRDELDRVVRAVVDLGRQLTPSPLELHTLADEADRFDGFRELLEHDDLADVDPWVARNLVRLVGLHEHWATATAGTTLLHLDIRGDNVLLLDDRVLFVDWPHACVGAAWIDLVLMLPSVAMQGGPTSGERARGERARASRRGRNRRPCGSCGHVDRARTPARLLPACRRCAASSAYRPSSAFAGCASGLVALAHFRSSLSMRLEER